MLKISHSLELGRGIEKKGQVRWTNSRNWRRRVDLQMRESHNRGRRRKGSQEKTHLLAVWLLTSSSASARGSGKESPGTNWTLHSCNATSEWHTTTQHQRKRHSGGLNRWVGSTTGTHMLRCIHRLKKCMHRYCKTVQTLCLRASVSMWITKKNNGSVSQSVGPPLCSTLI